MQISVSELKTNAGKYIALVDKQDIFITQDGKCVARLTNANVDKMASAKALIGILPNDLDYDKLREERISK
ncbi:MAG: type II toxin-antitoxin system Phd/YefM family antitoxin [Synergistaceae bacterium]|jgi:antitoxin (DNA-binding transcriptional repressor) of toxin-antitoxin stability system|nr:type II toxin-antitoxin system Phd/YefM family antitoxin [Synergistaceae bacterium]